ncbi:MAG: hypothetical protein HYV95_12700 [Opitutae bacterium]|nr:hypothetical protein [Opitutae bacterium]
MSASDNVLVDGAIQLNGESLQLMRTSQKKWFIGAVISVAAYAVAVGVIALAAEVSGVVSLLAMPLFIVAFQAGRLAGRIETVERARALKRG